MGVNTVYKLTPLIELKLTLDPILFRGHVQNRYHKVLGDTDLEMLLENARFQRNARRFLAIR